MSSPANVYSGNAGSVLPVASRTDADGNLVQEFDQSRPAVVTGTFDEPGGDESVIVPCVGTVCTFQLTGSYTQCQFIAYLSLDGTNWVPTDFVLATDLTIHRTITYVGNVSDTDGTVLAHVPLGGANYVRLYSAGVSSGSVTVKGQCGFGAMPPGFRVVSAGGSNIAVSSAVSDVQVVPARIARLKLTVTNTDANRCYLLWGGGTPSATQFDNYLDQDETYEMPQTFPEVSELRAVWAGNGSGALIGREGW